MDTTLTKCLTILGLTSREIRFFLVAYRNGPVTVDQIARLARIKRAGAFLLSKELKAKGLLNENNSSYRKKIYTVEPKELLRLVSSKQRNVRKAEVELEERLPELESLYQASKITPKVRVYEGRNGLISVWEDILSQKEELLLWTNQESEEEIFPGEFHDKFISDRIKKEIKIRVLSTDNDKGKLLQFNDSVSLRKTKLLPNDVSFTAETYIYGNKIAILDFRKDIIGIIIESEPIAASQRAIFEMTWATLSAK